jgi:hypothetical protein
MNEKIKQYAELSKAYKTILVDGQMQSVLLIDPERFADLIISDVISEIGSANTQHCALTTYDLGIVSCTQSKITNHLLSTFGYIKPGVLNVTNS